MVAQLSTCSNYNAFVTSSTKAASFADTIYPSGRILFTPDSVEGKSVEDLYEILDLDDDVKFVDTMLYTNRFDTGFVDVRYQQFFKEVKVEGGGFTVSLAAPGSIGGDDRCDRIAAMSPYVLSGFNDMSVEPTIDDSADILTALSISEFEYVELVVSTHLDSCEYLLVYKVLYADTTMKISWIDADSGTVLETVDAYHLLDAPTENYGTRQMSDSQSGLFKVLQSEDGSLSTYDFNQTDMLAVRILDFTDDKIPKTRNPQWSTSEAPAAVYQAHWVAEQCIAYFEDIEIFFPNIHIAGDLYLPNARYLGSRPLLTNEPDDIYFGFGTYVHNGTLSTLAEFDIVGHELTHAHLEPIFDDGFIPSRSLEEGICDIVGVLIESNWQGTVDWQIGDDIDDSFSGRDLENPNNYRCFDDVEDLNEEHDRSEPLGHWGYLVAEGSQSLDIPGIGISRTVEIVLQAVRNLGMTGDYSDLMRATIEVALEEFGRCSDEFISVARAWEEICVITGLADQNDYIHECDYNFTLPVTECEEDDYLKICLTNSDPSVLYRWTVSSVQSTDFVLNGTQTGNSTHGVGLTCLELIDFPQFSYYPQRVTIRCYAPGLNSQFVMSKSFKIIDCDNDDPTCDDFYGGGGNLVVDNTQPDVQFDVNSEPLLSVYSECLDCTLHILNVYGQLIYSGPLQESLINGRTNAEPSGLLIYVIQSSGGEILDVVKKVQVTR